MTAETDQGRRKRRYQRTLFDEIATTYDAYRMGYPPEITGFVIETAGLHPGSDVLEVGCGTGQLTESLAGRGFRLTAIDIGPSMVAAARRRLGGSAVSFRVTSFEDLAADDASFDLIVAGAAYHWVDPDVRFAKPARLLKPGGWLALLGYDEHYDDPLGAALADMWTARSDPAEPWTGSREPADAEAISASGRFGEPVPRTASERLTLAAESVLRIESTRSTLLSWPPESRRQFLGELAERLGSRDDVPLTRVSWLTMARVRPRP